MGIGDLFYNNKIESAINNINNKSGIIKDAMNELYSKPDFKKISDADDDVLFQCVKADLLRTYIKLLDNKSKEAKSFFKDDVFFLNAFNSISKIYELYKQSLSNNKRCPEIAEKAIESLNDIYNYSSYFEDNQKVRTKKP